MEKSYLKDLIRFKTDNNIKGINDCLSFIGKILSEFGWKIRILKNKQNQKNNLVAVYNGDFYDIKNGILLSGHIDTVVTDEKKWNTNPYILSNDDDTVYGLGIADMKSFTSAILDNLDEIKKCDPKKPIILALSCDEETVMYGIENICNFFKNNKIKPEYAIIGEPSSMAFSNSNKGFYEFETIIYGKSSHSSQPQLGINAVYIMAKVIEYIEALSKNYRQTTINVGTINGGTMCNIVPDKCTIRWDVRTFLKTDLEDIKQKVDNFLKSITDKCNTSYSNQIVFKIPVFEEKKVKYTEAFMKKYKIKENSYDAATEAGFYQELGIDCVIYGCGNLKDAHAINEKISWEQYLKYRKQIISFIKEICY